MNNKYIELCKQHIIDTIADYEGQEVDVSDFGHTLTEGENVNGSWYCSTYEAEQDLDKFGRSTVAEFMEEYESEFGDKPPYDAYTEPESFHCLMMIVGVEKVWNSLGVVSDNWNGTIKLTKKVINKIIEEVNNDN
jgi:hypothetical protein